MDTSPDLSGTAGNAGVLETMRIARFRAYLLSNLLCMVGKWMQRVAVGWLVWTLSGSEAVLAVVGAAELIPAIVLAPLAGVLADRIRPAAVVVMGTLVAMSQALVLGLSVTTGLATLPLIFAMMLISGIGNGAMEPARAAMVLTLVPRRCLASAVALDSLIYNVARFAGPALAGLLLLELEPGFLVLLNVAFSIPMLTVVIVLRRRGATQEEPQPAGRAGNIGAEMKEGFLYVFRERHIAAVVCLMTGMSFFLRPICDMLPPFVERLPGGGATELALLVSAFGIGALAAGLSITILRRQSRLETWLIFGMAICTLSTFAFLYSTSLLLSFTLAALAGAGQAVIGISAKTIMQMVCDLRFRGRVMAVYSMLYLGGPAIGLPFIGLLAELIELRLAFAFGIIVNAGMIGYMVARRVLWR